MALDRVAEMERLVVEVRTAMTRGEWYIREPLMRAILNRLDELLEQQTDDAVLCGYLSALKAVEDQSHDLQSIAYALRAGNIDEEKARAAGACDGDIEMVRRALAR